jgi:hypothetical protein
MTLPDSAYAEVARRMARTWDWDTPAIFRILHWNDVRRRLVPRAHIVFTDDVHVSQYAVHMVDHAITYHREYPAERACAFLLAFESYRVDLPATAPAAERRQAEQMMASRTLGEHPAARVQAAAWCVDITGRGWSATRFRDDPPSAITETVYDAGMVPADPELTGLLAVAYSTGMVKYGLPGPPDPYPGRR